MAKKYLGADLGNLDDRVTTAEQILPTLATKTDLRKAVAPLATKAELAAVRDELRTEMRTLYESTRDDIQLLADSVLALHTKVDVLAQKSA